MKIIFLVAKSTKNTINKMILIENNMHKDIILLNFFDSYYNLTSKIMHGFNWITNYCWNSKYILKINDDVIVNTFSLISFLKKEKYKFNQMIGFLIEGIRPIRIPGSKYFVSINDFPNIFLPSSPAA